MPEAMKLLNLLSHHSSDFLEFLVLSFYIERMGLLRSGLFRYSHPNSHIAECVTTFPGLSMMGNQEL
jgi:hypothetical protein